MDFDIKYVIVAVGALLIAAIVGHHAWRAWRARQGLDGDDAADRTSTSDLWDEEQSPSATPEPAATEAAEPNEAGGAAEEQQAIASPQRTEPHIAAPDAGDGREEAAPPHEQQEPSPTVEEVEETVSKARSVSGTRERAADAGEERARRTESGDGADTGVVDEYVAIWVVPDDDGRFSGDDLLRAFADANLEYGERNVFHRRQNGRSQFMVVNGTEPGTFDLAAMGEFSTPAVVATMTLPGPDDPSAAFNAMLSTARSLEAALGGVLKDEEMNVMSYQTIEHCRGRVAEFARRQMSQRT